MVDSGSSREGLSRRTVLTSAALAVPAVALGAVSPAQASSGRSGPDTARLTWFSVANCLLEVGNTTILIDGYITRIPGPPFFYGGGGGLAYTQAPMAPDRAGIKRVYEAIKGKRIDYILTSHSHFDHSFDTATWAHLTPSATVIGSRTTAYQCIAQGVRADRCHIVSGGEALNLGNGLTCRVIQPAASSRSAARRLAAAPCADGRV